MIDGQKIVCEIYDDGMRIIDNIYWYIIKYFVYIGTEIMAIAQRQ